MTVDDTAQVRTDTHICPLCEATCGLRLTITERPGQPAAVTDVRGDEQDVFSHGFVCPKGVAIGDLHGDPARLRTPMVRGPQGLRPASWEEAWDLIRTRLGSLIADHGPDAVGVYLGNPNVHNITSTFYAPALIRALGTRYRFSASTVDQMPQQVAVGLMFGTELSVPVPDLDRTELLIVVGANPLVSNGSMMTAPDMPGRIRDLRRRGGRLVVIDPVRTRTAAAADEHLRIRPGTDVLLLAALVHVILHEDLADLAAASPWVDPEALGHLRSLMEPLSPAAVASLTGICAPDIERLAREFAGTPHAALYGRMGTTTSGLMVDGEPASFATLASWLITVANVITGKLDRPGGVMFPLPAAGGPTTYGEAGRGRGIRIPGSQRTRVRELPSVLGEFPAAAMAEEMDTGDPATGERLRGLIVIAGNPVASTPDAARLQRALTGLDLLVAIDAYVTETSQHADVILPAPSPLARGHYDMVFASLAVRNVARWSPAVVQRSELERDEGEVLLTLAGIAIAARARAAGESASEPTAEQLDDLVALEVARRAATDPNSRAHGQDPAALLAAVHPRRGVERLLDLSLRCGPYGDGFGTHPDGLSLATLEATPQGVDLGPLQPRLPEVLRTPSGLIELLPEQVANQVRRLVEALPRTSIPEGLLLVGRRQLRTNNSWLRTLDRLAGGSSRCTLQVHPSDAADCGLVGGDTARLESATGSIEVTVEVTADVSEGVVVLPHGWSPAAPGTWGSAVDAPGSNVNILTPTVGLDPLAGTAVLNAVPVRLQPCTAATAEPASGRLAG
jgi:anaerobic selenocysteine-containing dehydrogenase